MQDCTGTFIGDPTLVNNATEVVTGGTSEDSVDSYITYKYIDAPYFYFLSGDPEKRVRDNGVHVSGGTPAYDLDFISNREHLETTNDERSQMRVISPEYITQFVDKFEELLNND